MIELLGAEEARKVIERITHYTKIYALVLQERERIGEVMARYGLIPDERPPETKTFINPGLALALSVKQTLGRLIRLIKPKGENCLEV